MDNLDRIDKLLALAIDERTPIEERRTAAVKACELFAPFVPILRKVSDFSDKYSEYLENLSTKLQTHDFVAVRKR